MHIIVHVFSERLIKKHHCYIKYVKYVYIYIYIYIYLESCHVYSHRLCVRIVSFRGIQMYNKQSKAIFCFFWKNFGFICPQRIRQVSVYVSTIFFLFQKHISVAELNINIVTGRFTFFLSFFRFWCISYIIYAWTSTCRWTNRWVAICIYIHKI